MSRVNVNLREIVTSPANVLVTATSVLVDGQAVIASAYGNLTGVQTLRTNGLGVAQFTLMTGRYEITAKSASGGPGFRVQIDVPDDTDEYEFDDLLTPDSEVFNVPPTPDEVSPVATADVYGLLKLSKYGFGVPEQAATMALARAIESARLRKAGMVFIFGGAVADDGAGGIYRFKHGGSEAETGDGGQFMRPDDYATTAGADQGTLVKFL